MSREMAHLLIGVYIGALLGCVLILGGAASCLVWGR